MVRMKQEIKGIKIKYNKIKVNRVYRIHSKDHIIIAADSEKNMNHVLEVFNTTLKDKHKKAKMIVIGKKEKDLKANIKLDNTVLKLVHKFCYLKQNNEGK